MMYHLVTLMAIIVGGWSLPTPNTSPDSHQEDHDAFPTAILVRTIDNGEVQLMQTDENKFSIRVYKQNGEEKELSPTRVLNVPDTWTAPGNISSRIVHAEITSNDEVVIVLYNPATGLDLIIFPLEALELDEDEDFVTPKTTTTTTYPVTSSSNKAISFPQNSIIFPNHTVPWHPTVSTPPSTWEWYSPHIEFELVTPQGETRNAIPEKTSVA